MEEIDLKELISMFLEKKFLIILVVIVFAMLGAIYTLKFVIPEYQSTTSLVLVQVAGENTKNEGTITTTDIAINTKLVANYKDIAKSRTVAKKVAENLNMNIGIETIQNSISVSSTSDTEVIRITVTHTDPQLACKIANETANVLTERVKEIYKTSNLYVVDVAEVNTTPCNIHLFKNIAIFGFVGGIIVVVYIILINMLDTTVKTDTDIERALQLPVLASIMQTDENGKKKHKSSSVKRRGKVRTEIRNDVKIPYSYEDLIKKETATGNTPKRTIRRKD